MRVVTLAVVAGVLLAAPAIAQQPPAVEGRTLLQVQSTGKADVAPDLAIFQVGIVSVGDSAQIAIDENSRIAVRIREALKTQGVEPRDVQTQTVNVSPQFVRTDYGETPVAPRILGYIANNSVNVRLRDLDKAFGIIDALFKAGANNVYGPNFTLDDNDAALRLAREDAVAKSREEADTYAAALGLKVVRILRVSDSGPSSYGPQDVILVAGSRSAYGEAAPAIAAPPPPPPPPLAGGEVTQQVQLYVDYLLGPR